MTPSPHAAVLLAAGGSARLGRPKQLLRRDGEFLVHRAARLALATAPAELLVVVGAQEAAVRDALASLPHRAISNPHWRDGLAASLRTVADHACAHEAVLILACDLPALDAAHLHRLVAGARSAPSRCAALRWGNAPGMPAVVPGAWFADLAMAPSDAGFRQRLRALPAGSVSLLDAPEAAFDVDTPADLDVAIAQGLLDP
ncbi:nucleotidyltransferase family protein [Luteimonas sp. Y-2-2-4F]|nr:nucleotidyltransferase family protein [Luteimonas sp. Y-2-2-4F]MCD9032587.1 nucleotidyltransferase family protein [Luteimonas sp. Y-2-2-4F]